MKHIFEEQDIKNGMWIRHNGTISVIAWRNREAGEPKENRMIYKCEINSDGMIMDIATTKKEVAEHLTKYEYLLCDKRDIQEFNKLMDKKFSVVITETTKRNRQG